MATSFTRDQFAWIVSQRATYVSADAIVADFPRRWKDTACTHEDVAAIEDMLSKKQDAHWQSFFDSEREAFLDAPTSDKRVRLAELNRMFVEARDRRAIALAAELLEQIAKEQADAYAPKGVGGKAAGADSEVAEIVAITRTVIDPAPRTPDPVST